MTAAEERFARVRELFDRAAELDPDRRSSFLNAACGDDLELRQRVEELLESHNAAELDQFLQIEQSDHPPGDTKRTSGPTSDSSVDYTGGDRLDSSPVVEAELPEKYSVVAEAPPGKMGIVYRAHHKTLGIDVAIKALRPEGSTERFLREARVLASIDSPHVVSVRDCEINSDGKPIIVMDWIDGQNLEQLMAESGGHLEEHVALPWMKEVCLGMMAAADRGVIHRDLKPSNILIDKQSKARVADFGLARGPDSPRISGRGQVMGTAWYMAPEQAEDPLGVDTRADIYSFGACFYHSLTGQPPFDGPSAFSVLFKHKTEPLVSPKSRNPTLSEPTSQLLERCLAKSPLDRFQSFTELLSFLESAPWHAIDDQELFEYVERYNARRNIYLRERESLQEADVYRFPNGRTLRIVVGDLAEQEADAIVSSSDDRLAMDWGVSASLLRAGGPQILNEALERSPARAGRAIVTTAGDLKARFVFHGITVAEQSVSHNLITEILSSCFHHADTFNLSSLAFPLLGSGAGGFAEDECLDIMFRSLARTLLRGVTSVRDVIITIWSPGLVRRVPRLTVEAIQELRESISQTRSAGRFQPRGIHSVDHTICVRMSPTSAFDPLKLAGFGYKIAEHYRPFNRITGVGRVSMAMTDNRIAMLLADAAGHGVAASLLLERLLLRIPEHLQKSPTPDGAMQDVNNELVALGTERFITALLLVLDHQSHQVTVVSAGQRTPFLRRIDGTVEQMGGKENGFPLGLRRNTTYLSSSVALEPGDLVVLHNDALSESINASSEMYGTRRIREVVQSETEPLILVDKLVNDVQQFAAIPPQDELCVICLGRSA